MENSGVHRILHHGNFTPLSCSQGSASCAGRTLEDRHPRACTSLHVLETKYRLLFTLTTVEMHYKPIQSLTAEDHQCTAVPQKYICHPYPLYNFFFFEMLWSLIGYTD